MICNSMDQKSYNIGYGSSYMIRIAVGPSREVKPSREAGSAARGRYRASSAFPAAGHSSEISVPRSPVRSSRGGVAGRRGVDVNGGIHDMPTEYILP
jgi:hypothetical protein